MTYFSPRNIYSFCKKRNELLDVYYLLPRVNTSKSTIMEYSEKFTEFSGFENKIGISVGIGSEDDIDIIKFVKNLGYKLICVDVANGYMSSGIEFMDKIISEYDMSVIFGNITNIYKYHLIGDTTRKYFRVGIGNGSCCTTRNKTGVGSGVVSALINNVNNSCGSFEKFIMDGGLKEEGDICKVS